jgi:hypothetical protein
VLPQVYETKVPGFRDPNGIVLDFDGSDHQPQIESAKELTKFAMLAEFHALKDLIEGWELPALRT